MSDAADESDSAFAALTELYWSAARGSELRRQIDAWAETALAAARPLAPLVEGVSDGEFDRAFAAAEPEVAQMITPDSVAEDAALHADLVPEERSPLAATGAFATRTMADLLERQGDRRGAERIRAALGEPPQAARSEPQASEGHRTAPARGDAAVIAMLERWLENVRRPRP